MKARSLIYTLVPVVVAAALAAGPATAGAAASADLATTVTAPNAASLATGTTTGYRITVTNNGPDAASSVVLTDSVNPSIWSRYPTKFTCVGGLNTYPSPVWCGPLPSTVSCSPRPAGNGGTVTCTTGSLSPGASMTIIVGVLVGLYWHNQLVCDTASVTSSAVDPNPNNNTGRACVRHV